MIIEDDLDGSIYSHWSAGGDHRGGSGGGRGIISLYIRHVEFLDESEKN